MFSEDDVNLDEPTNHMDILSKEALGYMLKTYSGTVLFVSHDRYFIKQVADALIAFEGDAIKYFPEGHEQYQDSLRQRNRFQNHGRKQT